MARNERRNAGPSSLGLLSEALPARLFWNLPPARLVADALRRGEGQLSDGGALVTDTGRFTGRSPKDKFFVDYPEFHDTIDWGPSNKPLDAGRFMQLRRDVLSALRGSELYVQELWAGADPAFRLRVRVVTERAWHSLFARNMFIRPAEGDGIDTPPDWTVLQVPSFEALPERHGTASGTAIVVDLVGRLVLIVGTAYAGEIKKAIFTLLNYLLTDDGVLPMHCAANAAPDGRVAVFFGLSGTGKTTLSADPRRRLIGDDEHGWSPDGVFNFEGGCYAKVIRLDAEAEPVIWAASNRFGAILENVVLDPATHRPDFADAALTENTRSSYPLDHVANAAETSIAGHPSDIVMLTADAFGVLPPLSLLTPAQAIYHFLSGYTARVAGTERGVTEPEATFSACFGAPFMPRHPSVYAELLGQLMRRHGSRCWLVNTGWTGGGHGVGRRMPLAATRALLDAALDGQLDGAPFIIESAFGLRVPTTCGEVDAKLLQPRRAWSDPAAYDRSATKVAALFARNFRPLSKHVPADVRAAEIRTAA